MDNLIDIHTAWSYQFEINEIHVHSDIEKVIINFSVNTLFFLIIFFFNILYNIYFFDMQIFIPMLIKSASHFIMFVADLKKKAIFYLDNRITDDDIGHGDYEIRIEKIGCLISKCLKEFFIKFLGAEFLLKNLQSLKFEEIENKEHMTLIVDVMC